MKTDCSSGMALPEMALPSMALPWDTSHIDMLYLEVRVPGVAESVEIVGDVAPLEEGICWNYLRKPGRGEDINSWSVSKIYFYDLLLVVKRNRFLAETPKPKKFYFLHTVLILSCTMRAGIWNTNRTFGGNFAGLLRQARTNQQVRGWGRTGIEPGTHAL